MTANRNSAPPKWRKAMIGAGLGAVVGFFGTLALLTLSGGGWLGVLGTSEEIAALVGLLYFLTAGLIGVGTISPAAGARFLNVEDADELRDQRRMSALSALSMAASGLALIALALAEPAGILPPVFALSSVVVLAAIAAVVGIVLAKIMDEMMRSLSREAAGIAFYLVSVVGGGWAMLDHLGFAKGPEALDWLTLFAGAQLAAAFIACARKGMLAPR